MQLEEAIEKLHTKIKVNNACVKEARKNGDINAIQLTADLDEESIAIETVLQALDNSIPKQVLIEKLDNLELDSELQDSWDELSGSTAVTLAYKKLLKGK